MGRKNLKKYDPAFKARVALEAAKEQESLAQIGQRFDALQNRPGSALQNRPTHVGDRDRRQV